jgi:hypothetical protein
MLLAAATAAQAFVSNKSDIIQIPAVSFVVHDSNLVDFNINQGTVNNTPPGTYYAAVPFTQQGQRVCSFNLVHRDNDADSGIIARLMKKPIVAGGSPFDPAVEMARVNTGVAASTSGVATKTDVSIKQPVINLRTAFYWVELMPGSDLLELIGVQIEVAPSCE